MTQVVQLSITIRIQRSLKYPPLFMPIQKLHGAFNISRLHLTGEYLFIFRLHLYYMCSGKRLVLPMF